MRKGSGAWGEASAALRRGRGLGADPSAASRRGVATERSSPPPAARQGTSISPASRSAKSPRACTSPRRARSSARASWDGQTIDDRTWDPAAASSSAASLTQRERRGNGRLMKRLSRGGRGAWAASAVAALGGCTTLLGVETCGPSGNESCCASSVVAGGTYNRSKNAASPATVSDFRLDRFEITVGRFRQFMASYPGNKPAAGAGAHPLVAGSGWQAGWSASLAADQAALKRRLTTRMLLMALHSSAAWGRSRRRGMGSGGKRTWRGACGNGIWIGMVIPTSPNAAIVPL